MCEYIKSEIRIRYDFKTCLNVAIIVVLHPVVQWKIHNYKEGQTLIPLQSLISLMMFNLTFFHSLYMFGVRENILYRSKVITRNKFKSLINYVASVWFANEKHLTLLLIS